MRTYIVASLAGAVGAIVGAALMLILEVGANTSCIDLIQQQVSASCAIPTAGSWAVALGAISGAVMAVTATAVATRLRR